MFLLEKLTDDHDVSRFESANESLNAWLRDAAITAARADTARTWVLISDANEVCGYFSVAPHLLARADMPKKFKRSGPEQIPAMLIAKLARAAELDGVGVGAVLLVEAIRICVHACQTVGGRFLAVDAIDDAAHSFYVHHGFQPLPERRDRLVLRTKDAAASLGIPWT